MAEPYLGEIKIVSFDFAPRGYAQCDGQLLGIDQNKALFLILGTAYGGDGQTTFALPDLRASVPIHVGSGINLGNRGGEQTHTLITNEIPAHNHQLNASKQGATEPSRLVILCRLWTQRLTLRSIPQTQPWSTMKLPIRAAVRRTVICSRIWS
jgi:microcystin-dependent protein